MNQVVPPRFLFRWSFEAKKIDGIPHQSGRLLDLPNECSLPSLDELEHQKSFAQIRLAWNEKGVGISLSVTGRTHRPECEIDELLLSDRIEVWIDTRNTQSNHRATKFCHHFAVLPLGGGTRQATPVVRSLPLARAREDAILPNSDLVRVQSEVGTTEYWLDAWFPAEVLVGYDPMTDPKIGFHYLLHDGELGVQTLAGGTEFPLESDPSLWQMVVLVS